MESIVGARRSQVGSGAVETTSVASSAAGAPGSANGGIDDVRAVTANGKSRTILPVLGPSRRATTPRTQALLDADPFPNRVSKDSFLSREFMELENKKLWPRVWQLVCREQQVARAGDWVKYDIADQSILLVRTQNGELKALYNTCLHRGSPLRTEREGSSRELRCRYHGWRWNLDGTIKEVTDAQDFDPSCITCEKLKLPECKVGLWGGWVFINMDLNAAPLQQFLGTVIPAMEHYELQNRKILRHRTTVLRCNWKTALHAFTDGYHIQGTHPQALEMYDDSNFIYETDGLHAYHIQPTGSESRPSPRLGTNRPTNREMLMASLAAREGLDLMSQEALKKIKALAEEMPEDMSPPKFIADKIRQDRKGDEAYLNNFHDGQLGLEDNPVWHIFPSVTTPQNAIASFFLRFLPYGLDPEMCLFDVWTLERPKPGEVIGRAPKSEFYADYRDHDGWGGVLLQDLDNVSKVQQGLHNHSLTHFICGYQDAQIKHHDRVLRAYLMG